MDAGELRSLFGRLFFLNRLSMWQQQQEKKNEDMFFSDFVCVYCSLGEKVIELRNYYWLIYLLCADLYLVVSNYIGFNFKVLVSIKTNKVSFFFSFCDLFFSFLFAAS